MDALFARTEMILGADAMRKLKESRVAVFGLGGVGGYALEALARTGVGMLDLIDSDVIGKSNMNRQILATADTIGLPKVEAAQARVASINPACKVRTSRHFFLPANADEFDFGKFDFIIDAVDTVTAKLCLVERAVASGIPIVSCMGTGNKLDPAALQAIDISKTHDCTFTRVIRKELHRRGINHLRVVYSPEHPCQPGETDEKPNPGRRSIPGSVVFVPAVAGMLLAHEAVRALVG